MATELHISMLGSLRVTVDGKTAVFRTDALRVLLTYLAAHQGTPQRRDTLAGLLSPDRPDKEALTYLRNRLTRLRRATLDDHATTPWFEIDRKQIGLRTGDDVWIDVVQFEQLLNAVEAHPHRQLAGCPSCMAQLEEAVGLVDGEFLAGLNFASETWEAWLLAQREHLQQRALEGMTWLRKAKMALGEFTAVIDIAQKQLTSEPWLEAAHRAIMQAHAQLGDRNAALAQFEQCEKLLWDELGVEPEEETLALQLRILENDVTFIDNSEIPNNLPLPNGRFFGREAEQKLLLQRLVDPNYRLITLVGAGGIGKTRLALELAQQVKRSFPDGVWFVPLATLKGEVEQIKIGVGEALGLGLGGKQLTGEQVLAVLRDKRLLLIFDNSEPVLDALGFLPEWLRRAPHIAILATSREPLSFQAESVVMLGGLPLGKGQISAAEALFAERAQMARTDFEITAVNLPQVREICTLVDGFPLGIGLAAAWVRRRSLAQIVAEIGRSLDFLTTHLRDIDPRHRSMRAVFETSWQLLEPEEQTVLAALSVFPASFSGEAAEQVAKAPLFDLDILCEKSLLQQPEGDRYWMHSLVRQFAGEKLAKGETAVIGRAYVDHYFQYATIHQNDYAALQPEWRNFSAAIAKAHLLEAWPTVLAFVQVLDEPWFRQIRFGEMQEGLALAVEAAMLLKAQASLASLLLRWGEIEIERSSYRQAEIHLADALILSLRQNNRQAVAQVKYLLARIMLEQGQDDETMTLAQNSMGIFEGEGNPLGVAKNLNLLALSQIRKFHDYQMARESLETAVNLQQHLLPTLSYVESLRHLARVESVLGNVDSAEQYLFEATTVARQQQDLAEYAAVLYERLLLYKKRQQVGEALAVGYECLNLFRKVGSLRWEALIKTQLGLLHQSKQEHLQGLQMLQDGLQIFEELGDAYEQAYSFYYLSLLYAEIDDSEKRIAAIEQARLLNGELNIPNLAKKLNAL